MHGLDDSCALMPYACCIPFPFDPDAAVSSGFARATARVFRDCFLCLVAVVPAEVLAGQGSGAAGILAAGACGGGWPGGLHCPWSVTRGACWHQGSTLVDSMDVYVT